MRNNIASLALAAIVVASSPAHADETFAQTYCSVAGVIPTNGNWAGFLKR